MDASPLASLPAELRNEIYELVLLEQSEVIITADNNKQRSPDSVHPALTKVCKQIRTECHGTYFAVNDFRIKAPSYTSYPLQFLNQWLDHIGTANAQHLQTVIVDMGNWNVLRACEPAPWCAAGHTMGCIKKRLPPTTIEFCAHAVNSCRNDNHNSCAKSSFPLSREVDVAELVEQAWIASGCKDASWYALFKAKLTTSVDKAIAMLK